jgi:hypothetical protein
MSTWLDVSWRRLGTSPIFLQSRFPAPCEVIHAQLHSRADIARHCRRAPVTGPRARGECSSMIYDDGRRARMALMNGAPHANVTGRAPGEVQSPARGCDNCSGHEFWARSRWPTPDTVSISHPVTSGPVGQGFTHLFACLEK